MTSSRRGFLKLSGLSVVAASVSAIFPEIAKATPRSQSGSSEALPFWMTEQSISQKRLDDGSANVPSSLSSSALLGSSILGAKKTDELPEKIRILHTYSGGRQMIAESEVLEGERTRLTYSVLDANGGIKETTEQVWEVDGDRANLTSENGNPVNAKSDTQLQACPWGSHLEYRCTQVDWGLLEKRCARCTYALYPPAVIACVAVLCPVFYQTACTQRTATCVLNW
ncbi:twin-arginine translocation signal domain-containing protein [Corynebacterium cystitidis]|uniref:twin-arginine translocation signal domain-containing protein n=1 Tax=Corynebacterium cystitidis TaxID=35757 RepID=UPI00211EEC75|nr:twin-arginine translocation signal domain-containing protein [Corynebacterium cystitidis]